jgi:DNA-directed RNA polymerase subunit RPC12/RpoP
MYGLNSGFMTLKDWKRLRQLLEALMAKPETLDKPWQCPSCGEKIEAQFTQCWKCGTEFRLSES